MCFVCVLPNIEQLLFAMLIMVVWMVCLFVSYFEVKVCSSDYSVSFLFLNPFSSFQNECVRTLFILKFGGGGGFGNNFMSAC